MTSDPTKLRQSEFLVRYRNMRKAVELEEMRKAIAEFQKARRSKEEAAVQLKQAETAAVGQGTTFDLTLFLVALEQMEALQEALSQREEELEKRKAGVAKTSERAKLASANVRVANGFFETCRREFNHKKLLQDWRDCARADDVTEEAWQC